MLAVASLLLLRSESVSEAQRRTPVFGAAGVARPAVAAARASIRRARRLSIDAAAVRALMRSDAGPSPAIALNLFPDVDLAVVRERLEHDRLGHTSWVGHVEGDGQSTVALTWNGRTLTGGVVTAGRIFQLTAAGDGSVTVAELDRSAVAPELPSFDALAGAGVLDPPPAMVSAAGPATIDLLVLYTPAARSAAGGGAPITAELANAVAVTNAAFQRSGVNAVLSTVAVQELAYAEAAAGLGADLVAISPGGGASPTVEALRAASGADLVVMVTSRITGDCGVAWVGPNQERPFSVTDRACLYAGQWSFTHEIGHTFGARHAPGDSIDTTPMCATYACAYREGEIRTLMAYRTGPTPRILNFSSSIVREPAGVGLPTGNSLQDNARRLNETAPTLAAFRAPLVPGVPVEFAAAVSGPAVTLSWLPPASGGAVLGYELEVGSAPGAADLVRTPVAAPPLVVTSVPAGTYFARLRAVGPGGRGAPSSEIAIAVTGCTPPGAIVLSGTAEGGVASLSWTTPAGSAPFSYTLGVGSAPGRIDRGIFPLGGVNGFAIAVPPGAYYVKAVATNACGHGSISNEIVIAVP